MTPTLFAGQLSVDDRGSVGHVNAASLDGFVRFYLVRNHRPGFVRAWHGHRHERKLVTVVSGAALVCCVRIDDWDRPSEDLTVDRYVLSSDAPAALLVPGGYVNGSMSLTPDTTLCYFSDVPIEQAGNDDIRFPAHRWDPWEIVER